jgi:ATP-dependent DNA helicase RecG
MSGKMSEYFNLTDWDESQVLSIVASFLKKNKTAKMGDFANLFIGHLSRKQIRSYIEKLVENGMLSFAGDGKMRTYSLSKSYESQMALITKAVEIGLNEMSKQAKDQKKGQ